MIKPSTLSELFAYPNIDDLLREYGDEARLEGLPAPKAHRESYTMMENAGMLSIFVALSGDVLIGFVVLAVCILPHYSVKTATIESIFVSDAYRVTNAGAKLLFTAEDKARERGAAGLFVNASIGGKLESLMQKLDYRNTHTMFFRSFL